MTGILLASTLVAVAALDSFSLKKSENSPNFLPQIAFRCGCHNQYLNLKTATWMSDVDQRANCFSGKLDIFKYCRHIYRNYNVTNILESFENVNITNWWQFDNKKCNSINAVKLYKCIIGEPKNQINISFLPSNCRFDHTEDHVTNVCEDARFWNTRARTNCAKAFLPQRGAIQNFTVLKQCGLGMFSAYEYVCCPRQIGKTSKNSSSDDDDEYDDVDDEDNSDNDDVIDEETSTIRINAAAVTKSDAVTRNWIVTNGKHENNDEDSAEKQDEYYRRAELDKEDENYADAVDRLENKHKEKIHKIMKEWSELEDEYRKMNDKESEKAKKFKVDMTEQYKFAVAKLESATKRERERLDGVHDQREWAQFHDRVRLASDNAISLAKSRDASLRAILHALQTATRVVEKNRERVLRRYERMLRVARADGAERQVALQNRAKILELLVASDKNVNKTIETVLSLSDTLKMKIGPVIYEYWQTYREEHTPDVDDDTILWLGDQKNVEKLLEFYENRSDKKEKPPKIDTAGKLVKIVEKSKKREKIQESYALNDRLHQQLPDETHFTWDHRVVNQNMGYLLFVACGLAILGSALAVIAMARRKFSRGENFVAVESCSPEERHVTTMQINGYENPTYKHFEQSS